VPLKTKKTKRQQSPAKAIKRAACRGRAANNRIAHRVAQKNREKENTHKIAMDGFTPWQEAKAMRYRSPDRVAKRKTWAKKHPKKVVG